jgi:DNA gyrase subunit A
LKPVQRKILFALYNDEKATSRSTQVKSSAVVGTVMKKYHPHGDAGIYGAIKPMANWFEINKPLIDPQGNWGNIDGDPCAAPRYTEVRLSKFGIDCAISELQETKNVVDWIPTYDTKDMEPEFLPAAVPILLINGSFGIGVGVKVEIPRHNMNEVIDATINLIKDPTSQVVLIPDHCFGCEIVKTNFKAISNKGFGTYKVRGVIEVGTYNGYPSLTIKSIPDITFLKGIRKKVEDLIKDNKLIQIRDIVDETQLGSRDLKYIYVLKKGSDPYFVRDVIYKNTDMEQNCRINFEVLDGMTPLRMSYKSYLQAFIDKTS